MPLLIHDGMLGGVVDASSEDQKLILTPAFSQVYRMVQPSRSKLKSQKAAAAKKAKQAAKPESVAAQQPGAGPLANLGPAAGSRAVSGRQVLPGEPAEQDPAAAEAFVQQIFDQTAGQSHQPPANTSYPLPSSVSTLRGSVPFHNYSHDSIRPAPSEDSWLYADNPEYIPLPVRPTEAPGPIVDPSQPWPSRIGNSQFPRLPGTQVCVGTKDETDYCSYRDGVHAIVSNVLNIYTLQFGQALSRMEALRELV